MPLTNLFSSSKFSSLAASVPTFRHYLPGGGENSDDVAEEHVTGGARKSWLVVPLTNLPRNRAELDNVHRDIDKLYNHIDWQLPNEVRRVGERSFRRRNK